MPSPSWPYSRCAPIRVALESTLAPEQVALWLRRDRRPFALVGEWFGGASVFGSEPMIVAGPDADPFGVPDDQPEISDGEALIGGGWVGWLGYGLGARVERLPPPPPARTPRPPFSWAFYDNVIVFDGRQWWFEALQSAEREAYLSQRLAVWAARLQSAPPPARNGTPAPFALTAPGCAGHVEAVRECRERIAAGEIYQANICLELAARFDGDPVDLLVRALPLARPRFGALMDGVVSLSPERFLRRVGRAVTTEPIKGTRPRGGSAQEQLDMATELEGASKDAAEHVMIVDLMRNDLGRVCAYGTIRAEPPRVEAHAGVWHLVSTVSGELRVDAGDQALLRATFPPGSVTGAPKVQAMKVISELEATARQLYTGAIGMVSPIAGLDSSVAIRTFELARGRVWFGAGGGIVADSEPEAELEEALAKAAGPIRAIGGRMVDPVGRGRTAARAVIGRALAYGQRPDPTRGIFETVLVQSGQPVLLEEHLRRLADSLHELYGAPLDPGLAARARAAAAGQGNRARMRMLADPDGSVTVSLTPEGAAPASAVMLMPFILPGGLGAHKWRDRRLLDALTAAAPGKVALLVDTDGAVLEASYANIWIVEQGVLVTPPADGRILPGVIRAAVLAGEPGRREESEARVEPIDLIRLQEADTIFLTSAISGRRPARLQ